MASKTAAQAAKVGLAELAKRVPPSQALKFKDFQAKHAEYQARVRKQPEKLPSIDWDFYRRNVRAEHVKWVDEFEQKYKAVSAAFDKRGQQDKSKYFVELDKMHEQVQAEVKKYVAESNERIKALEAEYERIKALKPYEEMTAEEYSDLLPDKSLFKYKGAPSFWPHIPEEQGAGPSLKGGHDHDEGGSSAPPTDGTSGTGGSGGGSGGAGAGEKTASSEKADTKDKSDTKSSENANAVKPKNESEKVAQAINAAVVQKNKQPENDPCADYKSNEHRDELTAADLSEKINEIAKCAAEMPAIKIVDARSAAKETASTSKAMSEKNNFKASTAPCEVEREENNKDKAQEVALKK